MAEKKGEKHVTIDAPKSEEEESSTPAADKIDGKYRKIVLIAVDGSQASNHAIEWYLEELHHDGNFVIFMHCFELPMFHSYQELYVSPDMWQSTLKKEADRTAHMEKVLMKKLKMKEISGKFLARGGGKVGEVVLTQADEDDVDMIVMGTRGHGKMMRALMGSVSHYVMSHARCPVMVFRDKVKAKQEKKEKDNGDESQEIAKKED